MPIYNNILETIGHTPIIKLNTISKDIPATIAVKCEFFNPLGSIKDRIGLAMISAGEKDGSLKPETVIIEPTSGNTGVGLAFACAVKGYRLMLTMPESMSVERRLLFALLGAELVLTPSSDGMKAAIAMAESLQVSLPNSWMPQQFSNRANIQIHKETTAEEIWKDTEGKVDIFVAGVGTGGTISGVGEVLKNRKPETKIIAVEPYSSSVITQTLKGEALTPSPHKIQGIGAGFIPDNLNLNLIDEAFTVNDMEAIEMARRVSKEEGLLVGISSGATIHAAVEIAKRPENKGKLIVVIAASTGERYLSTALTQNLLKQSS